VKILTWNIQATKGCDDRFDLLRIVDNIKQFGYLDIVCLQEVSRHIPDLNGDDQQALIAAQFPDFEAVWAPGFSAPGKSLERCEFGNLTLVKAPLLQNSRIHSLPGPQVNELQMPRVMAEVIVNAGDQSIAIFNTHLAFHSSVERIKQLQALTKLRDEILEKSAAAYAADTWGPYRYGYSCQAVILCGDLNVDSDSSVFQEHISDQKWVDCWSVQASVHEEDKNSRSPTCGCYDRVQWPQGSHVRDYFLATKNIAPRTVRVVVNVNTDASDHQPVFMEIDL